MRVVKRKSSQGYRMCLVSFDAGLRWIKTTRLTWAWGDVDLVNARLIILASKTSDRIVPIPERLLAMFQSIPIGAPILK